MCCCGHTIVEHPETACLVVFRGLYRLNISGLSMNHSWNGLPFSSRIFRSLSDETLSQVPLWLFVKVLHPSIHNSIIPSTIFIIPYPSIFVKVKSQINTYRTTCTIILRERACLKDVYQYGTIRTNARRVNQQADFSMPLRMHRTYTALNRVVTEQYSWSTQNMRRYTQRIFITESMVCARFLASGNFLKKSGFSENANSTEISA